MRQTLVLILFCLSNPLFGQSGWFTQTSGIEVSLNSVFMLNENTGYIGGGDVLIDENSIVERGAILKTTNGGMNWINLVSPNFDKVIQTVYFINELTGYAAGREMNNYAIIKTTDGGMNWVQQTPPSNPMAPPLSGLFFFDKNTGYTVGTGGAIFYTSNGGSQWTARNLPFNSTLTNIFFTDVDTGYLSADNSILKSTDGGMSWDTALFTIGIPHKDIYFVDKNTGYSTGSSFIYQTTNAGTSWRSVSLPGNDFRSVYFSSPSIGYCVGSGNGIYKTIDDGESWNPQTQTSGNALNSVYFLNDLTGYAVGNTGQIMKTINGGTVGIVNIGTEVPDRFYLHQNYPNPFNPQTLIEYELSGRSNVKLVVLDVSGKLIAELYNGTQNAGKYRYEFSGSSLPSGIYFYKLTTDGFTSTRKMVLLK